MNVQVSDEVRSMLDTALEFAKAGYHVFPLLKSLRNERNRIGTPLGWNHNKPDNPLSIPSTVDVIDIIDWEFKYGDDLHGYGVNPRDRRAVVLDVDVKDGKIGADSLQRLIEKFDLPKASLIVRSKSGGIHLYYAYPEVDEKIVGIPLPNFKHIDVRTENNFLVGPGSMGGKYSLQVGRPTDELVALPKKVVDILPTRKVIARQVLDVAVPTQDVSLSGEIPDVIPLGDRDNTLIRLIGSWVRSGLSRKNVILLTKAALVSCERAPGDVLRIEDYIPKIESTFDKSSFSRVAPEPLQFFLDNAVYVRSVGGVYEIPSRRLFLKDLVSLYAPHVYYVEVEGRSGKKTTEVSAFAVWKKSKDRKEVYGIGYHPVPDVIVDDDVQGAEVANLYVPPTFLDISGPDAPKPSYPDIVDRFERFCDYLFAEKSEYMKDWLAHQVQRPHVKLSIAPVMISEARGVGKNLFFEIASTLVGKNNAAVFSTDQVMSAHNDFVLKNHMVLVNESYISIADRWSRKSRNQVVEDMKMLITDPVVSVDPKFISPFMAKSYANFIFASNNINAVPIEENDRRFEVIIIEGKPLPKDDYVPLWSIARNDYEGQVLAATMRRWAEERKITLIDQKTTASKNDAHKRRVIESSKSSVELAISDAIEARESVFSRDILGFELFAWYVLETLDPSMVRETINGLFKEFCRPVYYTVPSNGTRQARQLTVEYPAIMMKGSMISGGKARRRLFTCRNYELYDGTCDDVSTEEIKAAYAANYDATKRTTSVDQRSSALSLIK